jgi:hypothetical protein
VCARPAAPRTRHQASCPHWSFRRASLIVAGVLCHAPSKATVRHRTRRRAPPSPCVRLHARCSLARSCRCAGGEQPISRGALAVQSPAAFVRRSLAALPGPSPSPCTSPRTTPAARPWRCRPAPARPRCGATRPRWQRHVLSAQKALFVRIRSTPAAPADRPQRRLVRAQPQQARPCFTGVWESEEVEVRCEARARASPRTLPARTFLTKMALRTLRERVGIYAA